MKDILRGCLSRILGIEADDRMLYQASLPLEQGGCGLNTTFLQDTGLAAYISSCVVAAQFLVKAEILPITCSWFSSEVKENYPLLPSTTDFTSWWEKLQITAKLQSQLSGLFTDQHLETYKEMIKESKELQAHFDRVVHKDSGRFLEAIPKLSNSLGMSNQEFRKALLLRLHAKVYNAPKHFDCICKSKAKQKKDETTTVDFYGRHLLCCPVGNDRHVRHDALKYALGDLFRRAGLHIDVEPRRAFPDQHSRKRPDITIYNSALHRGSTVHLDVTVVAAHPSESTEAALNRASQAKERKYADSCSDSKTKFIPTVFEVHGATTAEVRSLIDSAIVAAHERSNGAIDLATLQRHWKARLSTVLAKGNGQLLHRRLDAILSRHQQTPSASDCVLTTEDDLALPVDAWSSW
jgi:hypothetical protein